MMIRTFYFVVATLFVLLIKIHAEDNITYPRFPKQAEFHIESILIDSQHPRSSVHCIYDYDNNRLIQTTDNIAEYYNYRTLQKAIYYLNIQKQCEVKQIDLDDPLDGLSAVTDPDDSTTHIRPLNEYFLLSSNATYLGKAVLRGFIHVNQWISSFSNDSDIIWSFANSTYLMPWYSENYDTPVQRILKRKDDGAILQVMNIFRYKPMITRTDLTPPKGILCQKLVPANDLLSLQDNGMVFPNIFSVRIDASTTSQQLWHSVHLRYYSKDKRKYIRYDYTPNDNTQNPRTIILDYTADALRSYTIDRRTGSCIINDTVEIILMTSILHNPIETLIKYEDLLLSNPLHRMFQYSGKRPCRGSILCSILIGQILLYPSDKDEAWLSTTIEWGWSKRHIDDSNALYDYPVYLNLNLYNKNNDPPSNVHYEFYDYRTDVHINEFDVNLCYRSNQLWYQHLAFELKIQNRPTNDDIDNMFIDRRRVATLIRERMMNTTQIKQLRISQLELDHHPKQPGHNDTLYCIFTLLDRTPYVNPTSEIELLDAQNKLESDINKGDFQFQIDNDLTIKAVEGSLEAVEYFYVFNPNASVNQIDYFANTTIHINRTVILVTNEVHEKIQYSDGSQAGAVVGGMFVGILLGTFIVLLVFQIMKRKANASPSGGLNFGNISFRANRNRKQEEQPTVTMEHPIND